MKSPRPKTAKGKKNKKQPAVIAACIIVLAVGGAVFGAVYYSRVAPFRKPVLSVGGTTVPMRYFLNRARLSAGGDTFSTLQLLSREIIVRQTAPEAPFNIKVSEDEINAFLRELAQYTNNPEKKEFDEWYRQQLNESRLSEKEFREMAVTMLLTRRLQAALAEKVSPSAEHVHLHIIMFHTNDDALEAKKRLDAGEDFASVAAGMTVLEATKETGGDIGWFPRVALNPELAFIAFDELEPLEISSPIPFDAQTVALLMVSEKKVMDMDEDSLEKAKMAAFDTWLVDEMQKHKIEWLGLYGGGYDSQTDAWVKRQLSSLPRVETEQ